MLDFAAAPALYPDNKIELYSLGERLFRLPVFRFGVKDDGLFESALISFYYSCCECNHFKEKFDNERAERSLQIFKDLGAQEFFVTPIDERALIHMIILKAKDFEEILESYGAKWERIQSEDNEVFAIIPPLFQDDAWCHFQNNILLKMGWKRLDDLLITCEHADCIEDSQLYSQCFLYCHSTSGPFIRERTRAGFYLGMKQDLCFFDHRGIWKSQGIPSEGGFYLDVEKVYEKLIETTNYSPDDIWVSGFCGGGPIAAYLKARHHEEGINCIQEHSFSNFYRDFIDSQTLLARFIAYAEKKALFCKDIPHEIAPIETAFNVEELWKNLPYYSHPHGGNVLLIHSTNDERLSEEAKNNYVQCAQTITPYVYSLNFTAAPGKDAHADDFFHYNDAQRTFIKTIFKNG